MTWVRHYIISLPQLINDLAFVMSAPRDGCVIPLPFTCYLNLSVSILSLSPVLTIMPYHRTNSLPRKMCLFAYPSVVLAFFLVHFRTLPLA